jgi:hypothetical protein
MVVARAVDIGVKDRPAVRGALMCGMPIEFVVEDGANRSVGERTDLDARMAAASSRPTPNGRARRRMPRQDRKPCSGCGLCSRIRSQSDAVAGPMRAASLRMRAIVQSA